MSMSVLIDNGVRAILAAMAARVINYELQWSRTVEAVKREGKDPHKSAAVKEAFAHHAAAYEMLRIAVRFAYRDARHSVDYPKRAGESAGEAWGAYVGRVIGKLLGEATRK